MAEVFKAKRRAENRDEPTRPLFALLETMVERCGDFLHFQVTEYGILGEMAKMVRKARNMQVRDKILVLLESWQVAFVGAEGKYPQYYYTYAELKTAETDPLRHVAKTLKTVVIGVYAYARVTKDLRQQFSYF
ncbi:hypothetical protein KSP40_PGU011981 [Platanthera guangdongensis]|uniref:VHS domain-containing protein n=1 Tax=Platanthera guangdongensis TaxID=2320717 RepID=A0ABR2N1T5_9ASPA